MRVSGPGCAGRGSLPPPRARQGRRRRRSFPRRFGIAPSSCHRTRAPAPRSRRATPNHRGRPRARSESDGWRREGPGRGATAAAGARRGVFACCRRWRGTIRRRTSHPGPPRRRPARRPIVRTGTRLGRSCCRSSVHQRHEVPGVGSPRSNHPRAAESRHDPSRVGPDPDRRHVGRRPPAPLEPNDSGAGSELEPGVGCCSPERMRAGCDVVDGVLGDVRDVLPRPGAGGRARFGIRGRGDDGHQRKPQKGGDGDSNRSARGHDEHDGTERVRVATSRRGRPVVRCRRPWRRRACGASR